MIVALGVQTINYRTLAVTAMGQSSQQQTLSVNLSRALDRAQRAFTISTTKYLSNNMFPTDCKYLPQYLKNYEVWGGYSGGNPTSTLHLKQSLSPRAIQFIERIKSLATPFEQENEHFAAGWEGTGAKTLSGYGKYFFEEVQKMVEQKLAYCNI